MQHNQSTISTSLESVAQQFESWRTTRGKQKKTPASLWELVTPLITRYKRTEITAALKINYTQLKHYVLPLLSSSSQKPISFVEYSLAAPLPTADTCQVEFTSKVGQTVKVSHLTSSQMQSLISLLLGQIS